MSLFNIRAWNTSVEHQEPFASLYTAFASDEVRKAVQKLNFPLFLEEVPDANGFIFEQTTALAVTALVCGDASVESFIRASSEEKLRETIHLLNEISQVDLCRRWSRLGKKFDAIPTSIRFLDALFRCSPMPQEQRAKFGEFFFLDIQRNVSDATPTKYLLLGVGSNSPFLMERHFREYLPKTPVKLERLDNLLWATFDQGWVNLDAVTRATINTTMNKRYKDKKNRICGNNVNTFNYMQKIIAAYRPPVKEEPAAPYEKKSTPKPVSKPVSKASERIVLFPDISAASGSRKGKGKEPEMSSEDRNEFWDGINKTWTTWKKFNALRIEQKGKEPESPPCSPPASRKGKEPELESPPCSPPGSRKGKEPKSFKLAKISYTKKQPFKSTEAVVSEVKLSESEEVRLSLLLRSLEEEEERATKVDLPESDEEKCDCSDCREPKEEEKSDSGDSEEEKSDSGDSEEEEKTTSV